MQQIYKLKFRILSLGIPAIFCGALLASCSSSDSGENTLVSLSSSAIENPSDNSPPASDANQPDTGTPTSSDTARNVGPTTTATTVTAELYSQSVVPDVTVHLLSEGTDFQLQNIIDGTTPVLVWFWAPH